jgi:hypothetical protein
VFSPFLFSGLNKLQKKYPRISKAKMQRIIILRLTYFALRAGKFVYGQGEPVKVSHLLGTDLYDVLCNTAQPILNEGLSHLQGSSLVLVGVVQHNVGAEK